jgi:beta-lactamase regulating signal transducer with metallopeptidase domain
MRYLLETQASRLLDLGLAAFLLSGLVALVMLASALPDRRLKIARLGLIAILALPILEQVEFLPRLNLGPLAHYSVRMTRDWLFPESQAGGSVARDESPPDFTLLISASQHRLQESARIPLVLIWLYAAGLLLGACRLLLGYLAAWWLCSRAWAPAPATMQVYNQLEFHGDLRPQLLLSDRVRRPVLVGVLRPCIVVPSTIETRGDKMLIAVLTHELAHAEDGDTGFGLLMECLLVVLFPVLPLWWIRRQVRLDQEILADGRTVEKLGHRADYAAALVTLSTASSPQTPVSRSASTTSAVGGSDLYRRILVLLRSPDGVDARPSSLGLLAFWTAVIFGAALVVSMLRFQAKGVPTSQAPGVVRQQAETIPVVSFRGPSEAVIPTLSRAEFELQGELFANPDQLDQIELLGLVPEVDGAVAHAISGWVFPQAHSFSLQVAGETAILRINGAMVARSDDFKPTRSLRFRSRTQWPVWLRNLVLTPGTDPAAKLAGRPG